MPGLNYHIENEVATIVLNNPPQNRIGDQMIDELEDAINAVGGSTTVLDPHQAMRCGRSFRERAAQPNRRTGPRDSPVSAHVSGPPVGSVGVRPSCG